MTEYPLDTCIILWQYVLEEGKQGQAADDLIWQTIKYLTELKEKKGE